MSEHSTLKFLQGSVCCDPIEASERVPTLDIFSQRESRLLLGQFGDVHRFGTTPTGEDGFFGGTQIADPIDDSIYRTHIALPIVFPFHDRNVRGNPLLRPRTVSRYIG